VTIPPDTTLDSETRPRVAAPADPRERAIDAFRQRYAGLRFAPVVVVIPAFNEEEAIGAVLEAVPREAGGLPVDTLVVDDGSSDRTAPVALAAGVYVAALEENSGQGSALRLGYRLAREHGAKYIVTLDADGQWDPADVSRLLEPILGDEADFVLGSRVLGRTETDDSFRQAGVRVFAFVVRLLTGVRVTDTSSGVRAFVAEVTETVRQEEPQYQASELLVGAICQGYRVAERPVVMHKRTAGESKKGHNVLYGLRYGRTLLRTWWRDRGGDRALPAPEPRPRVARAPNPLANAMAHHWAAVLVLTAGAALRGIVIFAYQPLFWFRSTDGYLAAAEAVRPGQAHPWGYSGFLWLLGHGLGYREIVAVQHFLVLALAGVLYAFLVHRGVVTWLAALASVPLSLSPLLVNIEHHLLPEPVFVVFVAAAPLVLVWPRTRPGLGACAAAGLLAAAAGFVQLFGLVMIVPMAVYLVCRRAGLMRIGALLIAFAIPLGGYLAWMHETHGVYAFTTWRGKHLYARVAPFAQCERLGALTAQQRLLCDSRPVEERPGPEWYLWSDRDAPARTLPDELVLGFARKVIAHQPLDYIKAVAGGTVHVFYPGQRQRRREPCIANWGFPDPLPGSCRADAVGSDIWRDHPVTVNRSLAYGLNRYARLDYPIGPVFLACVVVALFALLWRPSWGAWRSRLDATLFAAVGLALTIAAIATANFSYRYTAALYCTLPIAAAIAVTHLVAIRGRSGRPTPVQPPIDGRAASAIRSPRSRLVPSLRLGRPRGEHSRHPH
jgi:glycosyltransferase involved in cell wall biosynthesis